MPRNVGAEKGLIFTFQTERRLKNNSIKSNNYTTVKKSSCVAFEYMFFFCSFIANNLFPRSNQSMTNKTFIADFVALTFVFLAGYAFMIVA
jgi:hypothetical protein